MTELPDDVRDQTRAAWHRYIDFLAPFRPELHRYCRRLTNDLWDAEDLVQDTLLRGFATLGSIHNTVTNPRGYLIRIATNLWIDAMRRRNSEVSTMASESDQLGGIAPPAIVNSEVREAGAQLMQQLPPQERAALLLKDVFDMSLEETARTLGTTVGAVKTALHRGRERLHEPAPAPRRKVVVSEAIVDRFIELLNASDLPGLLALMLDMGSVEEVGNLCEVGREEFERSGSWLWHAVNVHPDLPPAIRPPKFLNERAIFEDEPVVLGYLMHDGKKLLLGVVRFVEQEGRIARIRAYNFCPEVIGEVATAVGFAAGFVPYRFPAG